MCETINFGSSKLIKSKNKFKSTTKFYNISTISLFLVVVVISLIIYTLIIEKIL